MKFIDLFAGLGGFHIALSRLGHKCVFASEIKTNLTQLYEQNFGIKPHGDIRQIDVDKIPKHDILCAGFPCQPFSKAGMQKGLNDETNGDLFKEIVRVLKHHKPTYFILENVQHLAKHDNAETYSYMSNILQDELGYNIKGEILSPHEYNIPQHRQRLFIVGSKKTLKNFNWPLKRPLLKNISSYLDNDIVDQIAIEEEKSKCLNIWQDFLHQIPKEDKLPSFPIWSMEFGATYPFEERTPYATSNNVLGRYKGNFGTPLKGLSLEEKFANIPNYARTEEASFPNWKKHYIRSNRMFFEKYKKHLKPIAKRLKDLDVPSWQKFEWNIQGGERSIRNYIIQFRGSGIRLKKTDFFPSLVCVSTQIPIIGWENRYITKWEGAKLQGLKELQHLPQNNGSSFDALGNAVNADLVELIAHELIPNVSLPKNSPDYSHLLVNPLPYEATC